MAGLALALGMRGKWTQGLPGGPVRDILVREAKRRHPDESAACTQQL